MAYEEWAAERRREAITGLTDLDAYDPSAVSLRALCWQVLLSARRNERAADRPCNSEPEDTA